jgi:hypothetical protein
MADTLEGQKVKDKDIKTLLNNYDVEYDFIDGDETAVNELYKVIFELIEK